jgi:predicted nucleic acid-binding protein
MDAFDADALVYAALPGHTLGRAVAALFPKGTAELDDPTSRVGSVLLVPELLAKPIREQRVAERERLESVLSRLELVDVTAAVASLAASLGARYRLRTADAVHLATAVHAGADRFITNNRRDFSPDITELDVTYLDALAEG